MFSQSPNVFAILKRLWCLFGYLFFLQKLIDASIKYKKNCSLLPAAAIKLFINYKDTYMSLFLIILKLLFQT